MHGAVILGPGSEGVHNVSKHLRNVAFAVGRRSGRRVLETRTLRTVGFCLWTVSLLDSLSVAAETTTAHSSPRIGL